MKINDYINRLLENINSYIIDYFLCALLISCGLYFTFKTRFVQIRCFKDGLKKSFGNLFSGKNQSFSALMTAIAAQVGTGNIVGAASAILIGGAGSVFWMWLVAFFGMATVYAEAVLAQKFAVYERGTKKGGPAYYITHIFKGKAGKILSSVFAVSTIVSLSFTGTMVQSNAASLTISKSYNIHPFVIGGILSILCFIVYCGGAAKIIKVSEKVVPLMSALFIFGCLIVLFVRINSLGAILCDILRSAFKPKAAIGGCAGISLKACITQGVKKGLFSNEAGMGSTPHAHASANVNSPHEQGVVAMMGVFADSFVLLTLTSFVMLSFLSEAPSQLEFGENNLMFFALQGVFGKSSTGILLGLSLFLFAFTSIISWNSFGLINFEYLFGHKWNFLYYFISIIFTLLGSFLNNTLVWSLSDFFLIFMIFPNVLALYKGRKEVILAINRAK